MPELVVPVVIQWELFDQLADAVRQDSHPYRLRIVPRGTHGAWVELLVLPHGTDGWTPVDDCCHVCLQLGNAQPT